MRTVLSKDKWNVENQLSNSTFSRNSRDKPYSGKGFWVDLHWLETILSTYSYETLLTVLLLYKPYENEVTLREGKTHL